MTVDLYQFRDQVNEFTARRSSQLESQEEFIPYVYSQKEFRATYGAAVSDDVLIEAPECGMWLLHPALCTAMTDKCQRFFDCGNCAQAFGCGYCHVNDFGLGNRWSQCLPGSANYYYGMSGERVPCGPRQPIPGLPLNTTIPVDGFPETEVGFGATEADFYYVSADCGTRDGRQPSHAVAATEKFAARCCDSAGTVCEASGLGCDTLFTWQEADSQCQARGMRLCTREELESDLCCIAQCSRGSEETLIWSISRSGSWIFTDWGTGFATDKWEDPCVEQCSHSLVPITSSEGSVFVGRVHQSTQGALVATLSYALGSDCSWIINPSYWPPGDNLLITLNFFARSSSRDVLTVRYLYLQSREIVSLSCPSFGTCVQTVAVGSPVLVAFQSDSAREFETKGALMVSWQLTGTVADASDDKGGGSLWWMGLFVLVIPLLFILWCCRLLRGCCLRRRARNNADVQGREEAAATAAAGRVRADIHGLEQVYPSCKPRILGKRTETNTDAEESCCVCMGNLEEGEEVRTLPCGHVFHRNCIDQWLKKSSLCPMCRTLLRPGMALVQQLPQPDEPTVEPDQPGNAQGEPRPDEPAEAEAAPPDIEEGGQPGSPPGANAEEPQGHQNPGGTYGTTDPLPDEEDGFDV